MKKNKSEIKEMLEIIEGLASIQVVKKSKKEAVIKIENYAFTYDLKKDDWSFIEALHIAYNIEISSKYCLSTEYGEDINVFSAYDLLELRKAIELDKKLFNNSYLKYFYEDSKNIEIKEKAISKYYVMDYIRTINEKYNKVEK